MNRMMMMTGVLFSLSACHWSCGGVSGGRVSASPQLTCPGRPVTVSWSSGGSSVQVTSPTGAVLSTAASGSATFNATTSGSVSITVDGVTSRVPVEVQSGRVERPLIVPMSCGVLAAYGLYGLTGTWSSPQSVDPSVRVVGLRAPSRAMDFVHAGTRTTVAAGAFLSEAGIDLFDGPWTLEALLFDNETCSPYPGPYQVTAPTSLVGSVFTECR